MLVLERVPAALRGEITRWLLELKTGVFVGRPSAMVCDKLWDLVCEKTRHGGAWLVVHANNEQGFLIRMHGNTKKAVIDIEGLLLIRG